MLKVAITGGIACGKSTVSEYLTSIGYKVYSADKIYSDLLSDESVVLKICDFIGVSPQNEHGKIVLDKKAVSEKVFTDKRLLDKLNTYTHALVYAKIDEILDNTKEDIVFFEIPLLFESKKEDAFDKVIVILRNTKERLLAAKKRDGLTEDETLLRMKNQIDYDNSDFSKHTVIYNDGDVKSLCLKVQRIVDLWKEYNN